MNTQIDKGHQGDVQFKETSLPSGAVPIDHKPLALGEHSGHLHAVTGDVHLFEHNGTIFAAVGNDGAFLQHVHESVFKGQYSLNEELPKADHHPHPLKPNTVYEFGIHKKYNPFQKVFERVVD
jgi:hypothetical protein